MDTQNQSEQYYQKQKSLSQLIKSQFLKRAATKLIVSVSVFSLFLSHTTLISFLHYFNFYFSTLPIKLFSHTLDKNYTFLLCNGLLVFLAKYSGLLSLSSSPSNYNRSNQTVDHHESFKNYEDDHDSQPQMTIMETTTDEVPIVLEQEAELESKTQQKQNAMQQENENRESEAAETETETEETHEEQEKEAAEEETAVLEEDKEEEAESSVFIEEVDGEEEEEEEEGNGKLSDEELNKKFEDFIRKMKEELRIEARQQLIMV